MLASTSPAMASSEKETAAMNVTHPTNQKTAAIPLLDLSPPVEFRTASFGLG